MAVKDKKKAKVAMGSTSATPHITQEKEKEKEKESSVMADSSGLLQTLQGHVEEVRALIQCGICVRPLYEPYTLACGHTFCYGCLTSWFSSGRSHKTCPDCRAQVKIQPAPAYLVRAIVQMFTSNAELLEKGETTAEHSKNQREEAEKLEADKASDNPNTGGLFQGCFKPKPHHLGPIFDADDGVTRCPNCAWELEEDECLNCGYHVEDGTIGDSEDFSDMTDEDDEDDDNEDDDDEEMDDDMTDYDGAWVDDYPHPLPFHVAAQLYDEAHDMMDHHRFHHHHHYPLHNHRFMPPVWLGNERFDPMGHMDAPSMTHTSDNESEGEDDHNSEESSSSSEDEDDEEMESFIDDGSIHYENSQDSEGGYNTDHSTVVGDRSDDIHPGIYSESTTSEDSDGPPFPEFRIRSDDEVEDEEDEEEDEPIRPAPIRRPGQNAFYRSNPISRGSSRALSNPSSGFQNHSVNGSSRRLGLSRSHTSAHPLPQSHGRSVAGTSTNRGGFRNLRNITIADSPGVGTSATNAITVDDDSEDEMPVPATRRSRNNRR